MNSYTFNQTDYLNLQPDKLKVFKKSVGWKPGTKTCKVEVFERGYKVNTLNHYDKNDHHVGAIGFFSGAGGLDIGTQLAGAKIVASTDFDEQSVKTMRLNNYFSNANHIKSDIRNLTAKDFDIGKIKKNKLIIVGGPPCQPFSKAGYWVTHEKRMGEKDPRNMINEYLRIISEIKPDGFILENVESLLHPRNIHQVEKIEEGIDKLGYKFIRYLADARDFGVPQRRKRVFFIASKKEIKSVPKKTHGKLESKNIDLFGNNLMQHERAIDWLWKFDTDTYHEKHELILGKTYGIEVLEVPPGENYFALTSRENYPNPKFEANKRFWNFLLKLHPMLPSWTIPAQPGPWVGPFHWTGRRLRVPEVAALQTFPSDYFFSGNRRDVQMQIGNAVPPLLAKAMVEFLLDNI